MKETYERELSATFLNGAFRAFTICKPLLQRFMSTGAEAMKKKKRKGSEAFLFDQDYKFTSFCQGAQWTRNF